MKRNIVSLGCAAAALLVSMIASAAAKEFYTPNDKGILGVDDSASIQNAVNAAAKSKVGKVVIPAYNARTGKSGWTVSRAVILPGDMTVVIDNARLTLADNVYENFFRGANVWTAKGLTPEGFLRNVRIIGRGNAVLDGGKANDLNESTSLQNGRPHVRANCPVLFVNTEHFEVSGLTIENHRYWGLCFNFCRYGKISDIRFVARYDRRNQDGINLRDGCHNITIERISGQTGDDMIALSAIDRERALPYSYYVKGLSPDIHSVTIRDVSGAAVAHPLVALRNHNGAKIYDILVENVRDAAFQVPNRGDQMRRYAIMRIGNGIYWSRRKSVLGEISRITVRNVDCSWSDVGVVVNNTLKDSLFSNIRCSGVCASAVSTSGPDWGGRGATMENITLENVIIDSKAQRPQVLDVDFLNPGDYVRNVRLVNCTLVKAGERKVFADETIAKRGGDYVPVAAAESVAVHEGELVCDRSGRVAFEANFAEKLPGWNVRNYGDRLKIGVEELHGERALSIYFPLEKGDTLFELTGEKFPVEAGRGFRVDVRARGEMQMADASGQKGRGGTAVEFFDASGKMLEERFSFGFKTVPDAWTDSDRHGIVPPGAVTARLVLGADYPNFKSKEKLLVSRAAVSLKTAESQCVPKATLESVPFRVGSNPYFSTSVSAFGKSRVVCEVATAPDAGGVPGKWSAFAECRRGTEIPLAGGGWLRYRLTLLADGASSPRVRHLRFGDVWHTRWNLGAVKPPRVERLTPSPSQDLGGAIRFRVSGPVAVDHSRTKVMRLTDFKDSKKMTEITASVVREGDVYSINPPAGGWKQGEIVKFKVVAQDILGTAASETRIAYFAQPSTGSKVTLRGDGFTLVDGKPFFPIGIFSVKKAPVNGESLDNAFRSLKEAGFNLAHTYMWNRETADMQEYLDVSAKHGVKLLLNPARQEHNLPSERNRENVLAWYLADDTSRHWTVDALRMRAGFCNALDGGTHLTAQADSLGNGARSRYYDYIHCTDVFIPEIYTVCAKEVIGNEVMFVGSQMNTIFRELKEAGSPVKSVWALLQHFSGWGGWVRFPTLIEQRAMTYLAIVRGAHGMMWYTYSDSPKSNGRGAAHTPETWKILASVTRELAAIQDDLAAPTAMEQPMCEILTGPAVDGFGDRSINLLLKDCPGAKLLIAVNTADKPVKARITSLDVRKAEVLFEDGRSLATEETGYGTHQFGFTDDFAPNGVHVYRLHLW